MIITKHPSCAIVSSESIISPKNIVYIRGHQIAIEAICSSRLAYFKHLISSCEAIVLDDTRIKFMKCILKWLRKLIKEKHVVILCSNIDKIHPNITELVGRMHICYQHNNTLPVFSDINTTTLLTISKPKSYNTFGIESFNVFHPGIIITFGKPESYEYEKILYDCTKTKQLWF